MTAPRLHARTGMDTGWRNVTELSGDPNAYRVWIRRVGSAVTCYVSVEATTSTGVVLASIPVGFRSRGLPWGEHHANSAPVGVMFRGPGAGVWLGFPEPGPDRLMASGTPMLYQRGYARWETGDPLPAPAAYPGTPA